MSKSIRQGFRRLLGKNQLKRTRSLEIGFPTDFKHVQHVGLDDFNREFATINDYSKTQKK